jgi:hypothetical protein
MNRRAELLAELVRYQRPTEPLLRELKTLGWDWPQEQPLLILTKEHLLSVMDRFLAGALSAAQLQDWAENLECREDVAFDENHTELLDGIFFRLATPFINEPLTPEVVGRLKHELLAG